MLDRCLANELDSNLGPVWTIPLAKAVSPCKILIDHSRPFIVSPRAGFPAFGP